MVIVSYFCDMFLVPLLPPDPVIVQLRMMIVGIVVPVVVICILVVVCYLLHHYLMGKGHETPYMLVKHQVI